MCNNKMPSPKMKEKEFYCVKCRRHVVKKDPKEIRVTTYKNKKMVGGIPALISICDKCETGLTKFIKHSNKSIFTKKYGKA